MRWILRKMCPILRHIFLGLANCWEYFRWWAKDWHARDFEENVSDFATHFFRRSEREYAVAGEVVWRWLTGDCGVSWVALSIECACVDEMTNVVSVISHGPILLGGEECGHMNLQYNIYPCTIGTAGASIAEKLARQYYDQSKLH